MAISSEKCTLAGEEIQEHILIGKLRTSRRRLGNLIIMNMLVCPLMFATVLAALWIQLDYPSLSSSGFCVLMKHFNGTHAIASFLVWTASYICDMFLLLAVTTDKVRYCKLYGSTLGPLLEILILFFFSLVMWSSLSSVPSYTTAKFIIIVCSVIALVANFFNYFMSVMAEHFQLLARFKMMTFKMNQAV